MRPDPESIETLFRQYRHLVFAVCFRYLRDEEKAKDAVMAIFERLLTKAPNEKIRNIPTWLFTVAKNHCLVILRREGTEQRYRTEKIRELASEFMDFSTGKSPDEPSENALPEKRLHRALDQLKPDQRNCLLLFYFEEYSYREIMDHTGYTFEKVKSHIQNGKRNLKIILEDESKKEMPE